MKTWVIDERHPGHHAVEEEIQAVVDAARGFGQRFIDPRSKFLAIATPRHALVGKSREMLDQTVDHFVTDAAHGVGIGIQGLTMVLGHEPDIVAKGSVGVGGVGRRESGDRGRIDRRYFQDGQVDDALKNSGSPPMDRASL